MTTLPVPLVLAATAALPAAPAADAVDYERAVRPIFESRCIECHGPEQQKGRLRLVPIAEAFPAGAEWRWPIHPGDPDTSQLMERITLPADDEDRMPSKGDPLTAAEVETIRRWIKEGARYPGDGRDGPPGGGDAGERFGTVEIVRLAAGGRPDGAAMRIPAAGAPALAFDAASTAIAPGGRLVAVYRRSPDAAPDGGTGLMLTETTNAGMSWSLAAAVTFEAAPAGMAPPTHPVLVALPEGGVRLYFVSKSSDDPAARPAVHSSIRVDGARFRWEPGVRFGLEGTAIDHLAAAAFGGRVHLYGPLDGAGAGFHAVSEDGLAFARAADVRAPHGGSWRGAALAESGVLRFIGEASDGTKGLWTGRSIDGTAFVREGNLGVQGADPAAALLADGSVVLAVTRPAGP